MLLLFRERNVDWMRERAGGEGERKEVAHVRGRKKTTERGKRGGEELLHVTVI